jgi:hypothetical protein
MQVQEKLDPLDNPEYRKLLRELYLWLADGTEIHRLEKLKAEIPAKPQKRIYSRYRIKNADGSIRRGVVKSRRFVPQIRVRSKLRHPLLKVVDHLVKSGYLDSLPSKPAFPGTPDRPKSKAKKTGQRFRGV